MKRSQLLSMEERGMAKAMAQELATTCLEVALVPAPNPRHSGHRVRVAINQNPPWYRDLCASYASARRDADQWRCHKTKIKRRDTIATLHRLASGDQRGVYAQRVLRFVQAEVDAEAARFDAEAAAYQRSALPRARSYVKGVRVSAIKPHAEQSALWPWVGDRAFKSMAETRTYVGEFYEEATRLLFGADRHQIDGSADVCPDLSLGEHRYLEVKAVGCGRQGLVYKHRLEADRRLIDETGGELTYLFWIHRVRASDCTRLSELRAALAIGLERVLAIPFEALWAATRGMKPRVMNYRRATATKEASDMPGFRLPWGLLRDLSAGQTTVTASVSPFGHSMVPVPLHCHDRTRLQRRAVTR